MNISYNWLKEYVNFDLTPEQVAAALTSIGLETGEVEEVQSIKGGLEGLVIGKVLTCEPHPNSDHMHITTVDLGQGDPVQIVCGASNVAAGQKVVVATLGTKLYDGDECFTIKKSKLRGVESNGMICAEDEIGIGTSHEGIIVLPDDVEPGTLAKDYYNVKSDYVLEVDITPNRADACSHYGVARDLYAWLVQNGHEAELKRPSVEAFAVDNHDLDIDVVVENTEACPRYAGVVVKNVTVKESPEWLQAKLKAIGLRPINNIVDITNYIPARLRPADALLRRRQDKGWQDCGEDRGGRHSVCDAGRRGTQAFGPRPDDMQRRRADVYRGRVRRTRFGHYRRDPQRVLRKRLFPSYVGAQDRTPPRAEHRFFVPFRTGHRPERRDLCPERGGYPGERACGR